MRPGPSFREQGDSQLPRGLRGDRKGSSGWSACPQCPFSVLCSTCACSCQSPHHIALYKTVYELVTSPSRMSTPWVPNYIHIYRTLRCARCSARHFTWVNSLCSFNDPLRQVRVAPPLSRGNSQSAGTPDYSQQAEPASLNIYKFVEVCLSNVALEWFNFYYNHFMELHIIHYLCKLYIFTLLLLYGVVYTNRTYVIYEWLQGCSRAIWDQMVLPFLLWGSQQNQHHPYARFLFFILFHFLNK